jgi:outer membrane protein assembly factor BamB
VANGVVYVGSYDGNVYAFRQRNIKDYCYTDVIDPTTGDLLPDVAAALSGGSRR